MDHLKPHKMPSTSALLTVSSASSRTLSTTAFVVCISFMCGYLLLARNARFTRTLQPRSDGVAKATKRKGQRKQRAANWSTTETTELLTLRFQTEDIVANFLNQRLKGDKKPNWSTVASRMSTEREWDECQNRLKTLTSPCKKLVKEDMRTGNNTEDSVEYPPYGDTLLECLGPFSGLTGNAVADSEGSLATSCSAATAGEVSMGSDSDANSNDEVQTIPARPAATQSFGKRPSVFSLVQDE
ncbi:hypothetical protein PHYPSEUDO_009796 [Phytophthora pseudosyringae]|uniref:Myb-like domain-containing protein n=1 Tax=Phytophthora pseudosyringae TaxID=221518 RepID=A0A8T1VC42_9STRA|nr:hypothetical protein PHYPSEUDO_009796 [Phytophthora pseudosyringae]